MRMTKFNLEQAICSAMEQIKVAMLKEFESAINTIQEQEVQRFSKMRYEDEIKRLKEERSQQPQARLDNTERYFSVREIVETGLCSEATLKRRMKEGKLKSYKLGRSRKIAESDLNAFLATQKQH